MSTHTYTDVDSLNGDVEFDVPFRVIDEHTLDARVPNLYAPEVFHVEGEGHPYDVEGFGSEWEPLSGHTGQYMYNGAVMHESETLSGGLARRVLSEPGVYVVCAVEVLEHNETCDLDCSGGHFPAGWVILRYTGSAAR